MLKNLMMLTILLFFIQILNPVLATQKEWTFLVYLDGDCNLEKNGISDFLEMSEIGSDKNLNIVVQFDRSPKYTSEFGNWTDCRRFLITSGDTPSSIPIANIGEVNMGDPSTLRDFIIWGVKTYPAKRFALILWNHGGGWRKRKISGTGIHKEICYDETNGGDWLSLLEVKAAIQQASSQTNRKIDILGFDACLMGMIEIQNELKTFAGVLVASEESEPGDGWPYDKILGYLSKNPSCLPFDLAKMITKDYVNSYNGIESDITLSAIDLGKVSTLVEKLRVLFEHINNWQIVKQARDNAITFSQNDGFPYIDLGCFLRTYYSSADLSANQKPIFEEAMTALKDAVIETHSNGSKEGSQGISIYFPRTPLEFTSTGGENYKLLNFDQVASWATFLQSYFAWAQDTSTNTATTGNFGIAIISSPMLLRPLISADIYIYFQWYA